MQIPLPVHSYQLRSRSSSTARLLNCFPEQMPPGAKSPAILTRSPGVKAWATVGSGPIRGMYASPISFASGRKDYLYVVSGSELYHVDSDATATLIGNVGTPVNIDIDSNKDALVVVNQPRAYHWNGILYAGTHTGSGNNATVMTDSAASFVPDTLIGQTIYNTTDGSSGIITDNEETTVTVEKLSGGTDNDWDTSDAYTINSFGEILDDDFTSRGAGDVEFLDNFMLFREPNSDRFFGSDLGSVTDFNALQFANSDGQPDEIVGMITDHRQLILFGEDTTEFFENTGVAGFPFERNINGTMEVGCLNARTVARALNLVFWVARDYTVRRLDGAAPTRVSTHAIEQKLTTEAVRGAFSYEQEGHFFYAVTTDGGTYLYDVITQEWSERETYLADNWRVRYHAQFAGKELVGDWTSNKIGELDPDTFTEWGDPMVMQWTYQPIFAEGQRAFHDRFEIIMETGAGITTGQGSDPKIMLEYSDDSGSTWKAMPTRSIGKKGQTLTRAVWHGLGSARQRVYRASISDPVRVTVTNTIAEIRGGRL